MEDIRHVILQEKKLQASKNLFWKYWRGEDVQIYGYQNSLERGKQNRRGHQNTKDINSRILNKIFIG